MQRPLCWLAVLLALSGFAAAADEGPAPIIIPGGVADGAGVGYLSSPKGGMVAVDLAKGDVVWDSKEANRPLAVGGKRLVALTVEKDKPMSCAS